MRTRLAAVVLAVAALFAGPFAAAPAHADETHICSAFAYPYDRPCWIVFNIICDEPFPPLGTCR